MDTRIKMLICMICIRLIPIHIILVILLTVGVACACYFYSMWYAGSSCACAALVCDVYFYVYTYDVVCVFHHPCVGFSETLNYMMNQTHYPTPKLIELNYLI